MKFVTTPEGKMNVCGILRPYFAVTIDLLLAMSIFTAIATYLRAAIVPNSLLSGVGAAIVFIYTLLGYRSVVPSFGCWALGIKRYSFTEIEEYTGKGALFVFQGISMNTLGRRQLLAGFILVTLYTVTIFGK